MRFVRYASWQIYTTMIFIRDDTPYSFDPSQYRFFQSELRKTSLKLPKMLFKLMLPCYIMLIVLNCLFNTLQAKISRSAYSSYLILIYIFTFFLLAYIFLYLHQANILLNMENASVRKIFLHILSTTIASANIIKIDLEIKLFIPMPRASEHFLYYLFA